MNNPGILRALSVALLSAGLLSGCGGGGGSGGNAGDDGGSATSTATVALSGVAAKGLLSSADVSVYAITTNGTPAATPIATTSTNSVGAYSLQFTGAVGAPFVVVVTPKSDGSTRHADEVTGVQQALPASFKLRALLVTPDAPGATTSTLSITPFSELAVSAATKIDGGITRTSANQARLTVTQLLGFDPTTVVPKSAGNAVTPNEQQLAVLLAAVSKLAEGSAFGCISPDAGEKTACVVDKLSQAASTTSLNLSVGDVDASAALGQAVNTVLATPTLAAGIPSSVLTGIQANLGCSGDACVPATPTDVSSTDKAIAAAKKLFTDVRSDVTALFARGGLSANSASGTLNAEAFRFKQSMESIHVPAKLMVMDTAAITQCADFFYATRDRRYERPLTTNGDYSVWFGAADQPIGSGVFCQILGSVEAPTGVVALWGAKRKIDGSSSQLYRHRVSMTSTQTGFTYSASAEKFVQNVVGQANGTTKLQLNADGSTRFFRGTVQTTVHPAFGVTAFAIAGELPGAFGSDGTIVNDHQLINVAGSRTEVPMDEGGALSAAGSLVAYSDSTTPSGTLTVKSATATGQKGYDNEAGQSVAPGTPGAHVKHIQVTSAAMDLTWASALSEFDGKFELADLVWDKQSSEPIPSRVTLAGALRNVTSGVATEFLSGRLDARATGYNLYDSALAPSVSNNYSVDLSFVGEVTAPGRPKLQITFGTSQLAVGDYQTGGATLQYRSVAAGQTRSVVAMSMSAADAQGNRAWKISEPTSDLTMEWAGKNGTRAVDGASLKQGATTIGKFSAKDGLMTFTDGSFVSLDFGL